MKYSKVNYKYITRAVHKTTTRIKGYRAHTPFIDLYPDGRLVIQPYYGTDFASGPTIDTDSNKVPAVEHDAKYQLIRLGFIPMECRKIADEELREGMLARSAGQTKNPILKGWYRLRAWYYYEGVDHFAAYAAKYGTEPEILEVF